MNKINPKYLTNNEKEKLIKQIDDLITGARYYAKIGDPGVKGVCLESRINYKKLQNNLIEADKLYHSVTGIHLSRFMQDKIKDSYWNNIGMKRQGSATVNLHDPEIWKKYVKVEKRFMEQVSKRIEEGRRREMEGLRKLRDIIITY